MKNYGQKSYQSLSEGENGASMKAGKQLDALIRRHIFDMSDNYRDSHSCCCGRTETCKVCVWEWPYSTSISAAWEVVEKMEMYVKIEYMLGRKVYLVEIGPEYVQSIASTAPHAICLAALKAKGIEI